MPRIIAGEFRSRKLEAPPGRATRPILDRQKEALFNVMRDRFPCDGALDLFAGSGALGLEALSRGAARVTLIEKASAALRVLADNVRVLGAGDRASVLRRDALTFDPSELDHTVDVVFLDPPFPLATDHPERLGQLLDRLVAGGCPRSGGLVVLRLPLDGPRPPARTEFASVGERVMGESRLLLMVP